MAAANTDKLKKYKSLFSTTLSTGIGTGTGDTITPASVSGLPTDTAITLTFDRVDSGGVATPTKMERIVGVISGGNFTSYVRGVDGTTEQAHTAGAVIEMIWNADDWNDAVDWGLVQHNQDGTHGAITSTNASMVTASMVTPTINAGKFITSINDANGNEVIKTPATTSAVNEITVTNAATGNAVQISATGGDDNIGLTVASKGTGVIKLKSGSSTTNGHTVPNIADDTVALLAASQTLSNKGISSFIAPNTVASGGTVTTNSTTELTCIETTITNPPIAGQIFIVANFGMNSASVAGDYFIYKVYFGTTPTLITTNTQTVYTTSGGGRHVVTMSAVAAVAASGTQKIKMTVTRGGGTGTIASQSGETYVSWIIVPGAGTTA